MNAEQHLQQMIGALSFEVASLRAECEQLRTALTAAQPEPTDDKEGGA